MALVVPGVQGNRTRETKKAEKAETSVHDFATDGQNPKNRKAQEGRFGACKAGSR
jgi:hypothetical protein